DLGWEITAGPTPPPPGGASIAGSVFKDLDADGVKDTGEGALAGARIYIDADKDGVFDSTEKSVLSDTSGNYKLTGLAAGTHRVRQAPPSGYRTTAPSSGFADVTLTTNQSVTGRNFGATQRARLSGSLYNDLDGDGVKDSGEPALTSWRVYVDADKDGVFDTGETSTLADSAGNYTFNLAAGTYRVRSVMPSGYRPTAPGVGYADITLASGAALTGRNFAYSQKVLISGSVFRDTDGDRIKDSGEAGLSGWRVFIDANNDGVWNSTEKSVLSDGSGAWAFKGESARSFVVRIVQQSGFTRTTPTSGSFSFTLSNGGSRTGLLFGERPIA
ncbi:MAG TPA: SdrD B-like domain-containing protein, partial [Tepidisphaeraceae bacterium]